jgi:hypothetical protein
MAEKIQNTSNFIAVQLDLGNALIKKFDNQHAEFILD